MAHVKAAPGKIINLDNGVTVDQYSSINVDVTLPLAAAALAAGNIVQIDSATAPTWPLPSGRKTVTDGIVAHAGGGQASAVGLPSQINRITTCATAGDSTELPAASAANIGLEVIVVNAGATSCNVFPGAGDQVNNAGANAAFALAAGKTAHFICTTVNRWHAILSA